MDSAYIRSLYLPKLGTNHFFKQHRVVKNKLTNNTPPQNVGIGLDCFCFFSVPLACGESLKMLFVTITIGIPISVNALFHSPRD